DSWSWSADDKKLTFKLHKGVKWHDGKPFTAEDVKCTIDLLQDKAKERFRLNARKGWYTNIESVTVDNELQVTLNLKRPQPAILALLSSGFSPIYPCHVTPAQMRQHPIGTGPFKFVSYEKSKTIKVARNPDYWKPGRPYLDGIEYTIIPNRSTAILAFVSGQFDMFFPFELSVPLIGDVKAQLPEAVCEIAPMNVAANVLMNPVAPFDNIEVRRAVANTLDRKAFVDILTQGKGDVGGAMLPGPEGSWSLPPEVLKELPGYSDDIAGRREKARAAMKTAGFGPDKTVKVKIMTRNIPTYRDAAVILISQLKEIYIDAEIELVETANQLPRLVRRDYQMALSQVGNGVDDPDQNYPENYACGSRTYMDYCNKDVDALIVKQSSEKDQAKRKLIAWEIDKKLTAEAVRPMLYYLRGGNCWRPQVKGVNIQVNSIYNNWRFEDVWLDK
ncbi:MAG: ABC transporter substrate-binding protein, partial [Hyphomicrobiaceae bacterium]